VKVGMYDTKNFLLRAEKCVSCHLQIDHTMVAAGHPDLLAFELDTFSATMPPHWRDKGTWAGAKAWATGQVISLREAAKQLGDRAAGNASAQLLQDALAKVQGHGAVVRPLLGVTAADAQKSAETDITGLVDAVAKGDKGKIAAMTKNLIGTMNAQAPRVAGREFDQASTRKIMGDIAGAGEGLCAGGVRGAEQAAMALDRLYSVFSKAPGQKADKAAGDALDRMFGGIEDPKKMDCKKFVVDAKAFGDSLPK
jgi:hypothetical protein